MEAPKKIIAIAVFGLFLAACSPQEDKAAAPAADATQTTEQTATEQAPANDAAQTTEQTAEQAPADDKVEMTEQAPADDKAAKTE